MNEEVKRLLENIKKLVAANALEAEFDACILDEFDSVTTIEELNDYFEESMTYWPDYERFN